MAWLVEFCDEFEPEFEAMVEAVQDELLAQLKLLERFGPQLGRPQVDTLNGSRHANMKELRFKANDGVWRVACGVWRVPSPSIRTGRLFCLFPATRQAAAKRDSTRL